MDFEAKLLDLTRRGETKKVKWFRNLENTILPSQIDRLLKDDKSVWNDLVVPEWCSYSMLREWAASKRKGDTEKICRLCDKLKDEGKTIESRFVCNECAQKIVEVSGE